MRGDGMTALDGWENFYVIVGSSAGALIGLQFVVITLIAEVPIVKDVERASVCRTLRGEPMSTALDPA
jgi:hypothetical protein